MNPSRRALVVAAMLGSVGACKKEDSKPAPAPAVAADAAKAVAPAAPDAAQAAVVTPADAAPANGNAPVRAFFYEVAKDGKVSHMLGTMHLGVDPETLSPKVYDALAHAKEFAMETDLADPTLASALMRTDGKTLEDELGPEYWKKFQDAVGPMMAASVNKMKASAAAELLEIKGLSINMTPMDLALLQKAKDGKLQIVYLEPAKLQEDVLDKWLDATAVKEELDDLDKAADKNKEMVDAYVKGDEEVVAKDTADRSEWKRSPAEFDDMMNDLLYKRNASWIPELEKMFAEGDGFVAVGAAHLIGDRSVSDLLKKDGYTITRIEP